MVRASDIVKRAARGCYQSIFLVGLFFITGCFGHAQTPADYVPYEGPTDPWIIALPNPVPAGRGPAKTIVTWHTGDGSPGQVYVSIAGGPEHLFSTNPSHHEATLNSKDDYEFRLYAGTEHAKQLGTVKVTRERPPRGRAYFDRGRPRRSSSQ